MDKKKISPLILALVIVVGLFVLVPTVYGVEGRGGNEVQKEGGETVNDDIYVGANCFALEGMVEGDLSISARDVVTNGIVPGDVNSAPQNSTIEDDARLANAILRFDSEAQEHPPTVRWLINSLEKVIVLLVIGILIAWLFPGLIKSPANALERKPGASVGVGALIFFLFPLAVFVLILIFVLLVLLFSWVGLGSFAGMMVLVGLTLLMVLIVGYLLAVIYMAKIILGYWTGKGILSIFSSESEPNLFLAAIIGIILIAILVRIPWIGWLISFVVDLFGLGAIWLSAFKNRQVENA